MRSVLEFHGGVQTQQRVNSNAARIKVGVAPVGSFPPHDPAGEHVTDGGQREHALAARIRGASAPYNRFGLLQARPDVAR